MEQKKELIDTMLFVIDTIEKERIWRTLPDNYKDEGDENYSIEIISSSKDAPSKRLTPLWSQIDISLSQNDHST
jgi:hypothetical protein